MRVGLGYDVHKLVKGRKLILGGVSIPHTMGLLGHSDADVIVHALMDSLLGAAALGDIGKHFPDTQEQYKGISSMRLLEKVGTLIEQEGYVIENIDGVIIAQEPKLRPYIDKMEKNIAATLKIAENQVNIKATTEEGLGFTGMEQGIAAQCICSLTGLFEGSMMMGNYGDEKCRGCSGCSHE
ncbi:2-C-methyl-D-erythritol 2,4-cyclodiphosphate synthase [Lachnospiraceae bacterium ZAX-1]